MIWKISIVHHYVATAVTLPIRIYNHASAPLAPYTYLGWCLRSQDRESSSATWDNIKFHFIIKARVFLLTLDYGSIILYHLQKGHNTR